MNKTRAIYVGETKTWEAFGFLHYGMTGFYDFYGQKFTSDCGTVWFGEVMENLYFPRN